MRTSLSDFCGLHVSVKLEARRRGVIGRSVQLPGTAGSTPVEIEVDLDERIAHVSMPIERLPSHVNARITKALHALSPGLRVRIVSTPRAVAGAFRLETETLDDAASKALVENIAASPLEHIKALDLALAPELVTLRVIAPQGSGEWTAIGATLAGLLRWLTARWPASYR